MPFSLLLTICHFSLGAFLAVLNQWATGRRDIMTVGSLIDAGAMLLPLYILSKSTNVPFAAIVAAEQSGQSVPGSSDVAIQMGLAHLVPCHIPFARLHKSNLIPSP